MSGESEGRGLLLVNWLQLVTAHDPFWHAGDL